jgi:hypothetical protein
MFDFHPVYAYLASENLGVKREKNVNRRRLH